MKLRKSSGFTVVELLIVIIVIAILATIVISIYNNVQQKARNAQTVSIAQAYKKALIEYASINGNYPDGANQGCLGEGYPSNDCWRGGHENSTFNTNLRPYMGGRLPLPNTTPVTISWSPTGHQVGAILLKSTATTLDGEIQLYWLIYTIEGASNKCQITVPIITSWPAFSSSNPTGRSEGYPDGVGCWIPMPDPTKL